ncbi:hypothetical protein BO94DRAFT_556661 [Aspergillus sclerotioniger CBS 115572]|uniref:Uncharacterized protein n=1 Tax=Aspergillus sclerotioniger CBS 115572 TaxID=1450535 RepID=A0A317WKZ9_9EURO|nr:hypothetical protein BO94DRAFT_556661 [Aspergillus sclerotioniger CBS 115572]PWY87164.1 hypothetical protein BO94DRAFT_556661 [Aspergillus sclerotioniger CBS 115572]
MSLYSRFQPLAWRRACLPFGISPSQCRHVSVNNWRASYTEPTPSQLLRFALMGTTKPSGNDVSNPELDQHLSDIFLGDWPLGSLPPPFWSSSQRLTESPDDFVSFKGLKHDVRNLRHLQVFVERNVSEEEGSLLLQAQSCTLLAQALKRCQRHNSYGEILSALNAIITRLEKLGLPCSGNLYFLGMYYAALTWSAPALERFIEGYHSVSSSPLDSQSSTSLVDALLDALHSLRFRGKAEDTSAILDLITGRWRSERDLHSLLCWVSPDDPTASSGQYLSLLARLGSEKLLTEAWSQTLQRLSSGSSFELFQSVYSCVVALVDIGDIPKAIQYLAAVSKHAKDTLPGISRFNGLNALLASEAISALLPQLAGRREYLKLLEVQLVDMEGRLGLCWEPGESYHRSASDPLLLASEQPLLTLDGDSTGYESTERFLAEMRALGCSRSARDLGQIAELLDEHEGDVIPVSVPSIKDSKFEFAWFPRLAPVPSTRVVSSATEDTTSHWIPSTLGLIRVSYDNNGVPLTSERSIHAMQLGLLVRRHKCTNDSRPDYAHPWEETGHMVAWDRVYGQLIAVFSGQSNGPIEHRIETRAARPRSGLSAITTIGLPGDTSSTSNTDLIHSIGNGSMHYHIDADPGPDLLL